MHGTVKGQTQPVLYSSSHRMQELMLLFSESPVLSSCVESYMCTQPEPSHRVIGASMSEPLSSDLNMNFVCLSVCGWMDRQLTVNHFRLLFCTFCVMH